MVSVIIEKELRDIISSRKFAVSFAVSALLIVLAFYSGAVRYHTAVARHDAAVRENLKQMEGVADWLMVRNHRIFLPPEPLACLVSGIANDMATTTSVRSRGEMPQDDTRYNDEPVFAVFRFLDLEFIFQIVLSLFAVLFAYDAINGEKERGTLQLTLANPVPRRVILTGKVLGSLCALGIPLLLPILLGALVLIVFGVPMNTDDWLRLALIVVAGLLYFSVFLTLSVAVSALTRRSSHSFLMLLVIWILTVLVVPRSAVLFAGRAVEVPSVDEIGSQMARLNQQLFSEDREKMASFKPGAPGEPQKAMEEFQKFMGKIADEREQRMNDLSSRLNEERANRQVIQQRVAFGIARVSPSACFALAAGSLAGTGLSLQAHYRREAQMYQQTYAKFIMDKTGMNPGGGLVFRMINDGEKPKPIDPKEMPPFQYNRLTLHDQLPEAAPDLALLALFNVVFFGIAQAAFQRYDVR